MKVNIIMASAPNGVIGADNAIPWKLREDMKLFKSITMGHTVVMGARTWESLGKWAPLPGRQNVVISSKPTSALTTVCSLEDIKALQSEVWIIGGAQLYHAVLSNPSFEIGVFVVSHVDKVYQGDTIFRNIYDYRVKSAKQCEGFQVLRYEPYLQRNESKYLNLLRRLIEEGVDQDDRTGVGTRALFGEQLTFDLQEGFPLLTTKRMAWQAIQAELFFFLVGKTNTKELEAQGVNIWRAHTSAEFLASRGLPYAEGQMGPMYGAQWRNFNGKGIDQFARVIDELRRDPFSRRLVMTTYNPAQVDEGVLWPCHGIVLQFFCHRKDARLHLSALMYQRSADAFLGLPFNIASYAALVHLVARAVDMVPDRLVISLGNVHLYNNHLAQATEQLMRAPLAAPKLEVMKDIEDWGALDASWLKLWGYFYYPSIKAPIAV
jgi:thymidylate synthase